MSKYKNATEFCGKFNIEDQPYIQHNEKKSEKIFSYLSFETFNLHMQGTSTIPKTDKKYSQVKLNVEESLVLYASNIEISSKELKDIVSKSGSKGHSSIVFYRCRFDVLDIGVLTANIIFRECTISSLKICDKKFTTVSQSFNIEGGCIKECLIHNSMITNKFYINK